MTNGKIIRDDGEISQSFNNYFANAVKLLYIQENRYILTENRYIANPIDAAIRKSELHPSILKIKEIIKISSSFSFSEVTLQEIEQYLKNMNPKKSTTSTAFHQDN